MEQETENIFEIPIFKQKPPPYEAHPVNYLSYIGSRIHGFRNSLPKELRPRLKFGKHLSKYLGSPVDRARIARAENGDPTVSFGIYLAILYEMGVMPDVIKSISDSNSDDLRYLSLINSESSPAIEEAVKKAEQKLSERTKSELKK